jgi:osmotically-inducible protein OsmY
MILRKHRPTLQSLAAVALTTALLAGGVAGCAPLLFGGAVVGSGLVVSDRRTAGTQLEDEAIEIKAASRARELATLGHINAISYNRTLLLVGEVPTEADKAAVGQAVSRIENVRSVVNELAAMPNSSVGNRSNDAILSGKVKATFVDAKDLQSNAFKVVTDRGIVYLMGRVTEREATRGADLSRAIPGVQKVVRVFEILSEDELAALSRQGPASAPK